MRGIGSWTSRFFIYVYDFFLPESYVNMVCDSSGGDIVDYIPLLPDEQLLDDVFSIYKKRDVATTVVLYISRSILMRISCNFSAKFRSFLEKFDALTQVLKYLAIFSRTSFRF